MRVLHVVEDLGPGDVGAYVAEFVRHAGAGFECQVWSLAAGGLVDPREASAAAPPQVPAPASHDLKVILADRLRGPVDWVRLGQMLRHDRIKVVHAHGAEAANRVAPLAAWAQVPVLMASAYRAPTVTVAAAGTGFGGWTVRRAARVSCVCESVRRSLAVRWPWAADRFVTVLGGVSALPVPQPKVLTRSELGLGEDDRVVLLAGVPAPETGHAIGIEAFARLWRRLPEARLVIAGAEGRRAVLERRVRELEIEAVVRFAEAERPIADLLEAADVLLCPALRAGLPVPLLQAMRTGCPAVASRVGGIPEAVVDGETGWLVPPADPRAAAEALLHVLHDPARTRAFAAAARDRAAQDFDAPRMVAEAERHYRAGLAASRASAAARAREAAAQGG